ncbi:molybdenum cofactor biosynthesis protein, partial [Candidatus Acetothermia bacterium]
MKIKLGILTVSDRSFRGEREDESGPMIRKLVLEHLDAEVAAEGIVPDEPDAIVARLIEWCDERKLNLILTTGGTGFSPRDLTPEATRKVITREAPGFSEAMRMDGFKKTPHALLSRGISGIKGKTLIINLPGSPKAVAEGLLSILP